MPDINPEEIHRVHEWVRTYGPANCWTGTSGAVAATMLKMLKHYESQSMEQGRDGLAYEFTTQRFTRYVLWDAISGLELDMLHPTIEAARAHWLDLQGAGEETNAAILKIDCDLEYVADVLPLAAERTEVDPQGSLFPNH